MACSRPYLLIVEPDSLAQWSMKTFLQRWFEVWTAESLDQAEHALRSRGFEALVVSDELPREMAAALEQRARRCNPHLASVRTVTGVSEPGGSPARTLRIEKPFELRKLARLLGVPDEEIPVQ